MSMYYKTNNILSKERRKLYCDTDAMTHSSQLRERRHWLEQKAHSEEAGALPLQKRPGPVAAHRHVSHSCTARALSACVCLWYTCSNMPKKPHSLHATSRPQPLNACGKARTFDQRPSPLASAACCAASSSA